jgi:tyrosyl-tRNA synthetase
VDLVRRVESAAVHALTTPLVTDSEGRKFGKSTGGGNVWLDPVMTSPYAWYQYFVNVGDADVGGYLRLFTFLDQEELADLAEQTTSRPQARAAQRRLAGELATLVHGAEETRRVIQASEALFGRAELGELDEATLAAAMAEIPSAHVPMGAAPTIVDLLVETGLTESKGAARRAVAEGGAYVNNSKIADPAWTPSTADLLHGRWLVLRRGKRHSAGVDLAADVPDNRSAQP